MEQALHSIALRLAISRCLSSSRSFCKNRSSLMIIEIPSINSRPKKTLRQKTIRTLSRIIGVAVANFEDGIMVTSQITSPIQTNTETTTDLTSITDKIGDLMITAINSGETSRVPGRDLIRKNRYKGTPISLMMKAAKSRDREGVLKIRSKTNRWLKM